MATPRQLSSASDSAPALTAGSGNAPEALAPHMAPLTEHESDSYHRRWQQPLGDVHVKLNSIVGTGALNFDFECDDAEFVFALTSRWPIGVDAKASTHEADVLKLADALGELARLYAIETGHEKLHVILEARRGTLKIPSWWQSAPCLYATYAFNTGFAEIGLFSNPHEAHDEMELFSHPHRLMVAIGPAAPKMCDVDGSEIEIDPDEERLSSLRKWSQRLRAQLNILLAGTFDGGEMAAEAVVKTLGRIRDLSTRLSLQIFDIEKRIARPRHKPGDHMSEELISDAGGMSFRPGRKQAELTPARREAEIANTIAELRLSLREEALNAATPAAVRAELQRGLQTLNALEPILEKPKPEPEKKKAQKAKIYKPISRKMPGLEPKKPKRRRMGMQGMHLKPAPQI